MKRRTFIKRIGSIPFLTPVLWHSTSGEVRSQLPMKRVRLGDPEWPTQTSWDRLAQQVGGRLVKVVPVLNACQTEPSGPACRSILEDLQNPFYISTEVSATQISGWLNAWKSSPSVYAVATKNSEDVAAAVNFARENNLRLVVKGGGHSYQGTSNSEDSLLVWTRGMNEIVLHDKFVPRGCSEKYQGLPAVTLGAGVVWVEAYDAVTTKSGRYVQGGGCTTVGVAGLIQSGGFGSFSKNFGLAAANLLEAEIVTADGIIRTVNACTNPDLFWAIKGGGGGSFGIVTKLTLKTHDLPNLFGAVILSIQASSDSSFLKLIDRFVSFYRDTLFNPLWGESVSIRPDNVLAIKMLFHSMDDKSAEKVWRPFLDWITAAPEEFRIIAAPLIGSIPARHWWDAQFLHKNLPQIIRLDPRSNANPAHFWWAGDNDQVGVFIHGYESAWMPAYLLEPERQQGFVNALFRGSRHWTIALHFNKGLAGGTREVLEAARDTATNPAVLDAFALAIIGGGSAPVYPELAGHRPDPVSAKRDAEKISLSMKELTQIVPNPGSYVSESDFFHPSWRNAFWGNNYSKLLQIKSEYDPTGLFFVRHGVGSEEWSSDGFTRLSPR